MQKEFLTPGPVRLYVEVGSGDVAVTASDVDRTTVQVSGRDAEDVVVEQRDDEIVVIGPRQRFGLFHDDRSLIVRVSLPAHSDLATKLGSADLVTQGGLGSARLRTGSGAVRVAECGDASVLTGSGDVDMGAVAGDLDLKTGSGDVAVQQVHGSASLVSGSGDLRIGTVEGSVSFKSGSGDAEVGRAGGGAHGSTASGDVTIAEAVRGVLRVQTASGDVRVGVPGGVPVWTDVSTVSGRIHSDLAGAGEPAEGQDYLELRARTVSGDVQLRQL